jgi:hypothetical protein
MGQIEENRDMAAQITRMQESYAVTQDQPGQT